MVEESEMKEISKIEPDMLEKYKTKYITLVFEIENIQYSEKLKRTVVRYPILRT